MTPARIAAASVFILVLLAGLRGGASVLPAPPDPMPPPVDGPPDAPDSGCEHGCSLGQHDLPTLDPEDFDELLAAYAAGPLNEDNAALETLLFHGAETAALLAVRPDATLGAEHRVFLERELTRRLARIELRIVTLDGEVLTRLTPHLATLGVKTHVHPTESSLPPLEFSGTVKRVGLFHLWTRF